MLLLGLLVACPDLGAAHPHVFVEHSVALLFGARGLEGLRFSWEFDEMFSTMLFETFASKKDRTFSAEAAKLIERKHFVSPKDYDQYFEIRLNGEVVPVTSVGEFEVRPLGERVTYGFTVPLGGPAPPEGTVEILVEDVTYYTDFTLRGRSPVEVRNAASYTVDCRVVKDPKGVPPDVITCAYKRKGR